MLGRSVRGADALPELGRLLDDPEKAVRDAAVGALETLARRAENEAGSAASKLRAG